MCEGLHEVLFLRWLSVKQSGVILLHTVGIKVSLSSCNSINTGIPEKVITETSGRKSSMALQCNKHTSSVQQHQAVTIILFQIPYVLM